MNSSKVKCILDYFFEMYGYCFGWDCIGSYCGVLGGVFLRG